MMASITWFDLQLSLDFADAGQKYDGGAWFNRKTGELWTCGDGIWGPQEPAEDLNQSPDFVPAPNSHDLRLGVPLAMDFAYARLPDQVEEIRALFHRKGGWRNFRTLIARQNVEQEWFAWQDAATEKALREWAAEEGFEVI